MALPLPQETVQEMADTSSGLDSPVELFNVHFARISSLQDSCGVALYTRP